MREMISPEEAERRLRVIFPRAAFDSVLSSPSASMAVSAFLYVDAMCTADDDPATVYWARPSMVMWMSREALSRDTDAERIAWRSAAVKKRKYVEILHNEWRVPFQPAYGDNTREGVRDETFREWRNLGAIRKRAGIPTTSSRGRWALLDHFADLFDPDLTGEEFEHAASHWQQSHLAPAARLKAEFARNMEAAKHAVTVNLPDGTRRTLGPGETSVILKGVVEVWAPMRLIRPVVLTISEPGDKVHLADEQLLRRLGITIDRANVLPDAVIADIDADPVEFWIVEAVATDGPVSEERRQALLVWAGQQNIQAEWCFFLTAFVSRNAPAAKKRLKDIASGTWAWFADEPYHELAWYEMSPDDG